MAKGRKPFRTLGTRMQTFGRAVMRQYTPPTVAPPLQASAPAPSWQPFTQTPLAWPENAPQQPIPAAAPPQTPPVAEIPEAAPIEPVQPVSQQQPPQAPPPVQRRPVSPKEGGIEPRLLKILERHQEADAERAALREQKKQQVLAQRQMEENAGQTQPQMPRRKGRASFDYREVSVLKPGDETPEPTSHAPQTTPSALSDESDVETEVEAPAQPTFSAPSTESDMEAEMAQPQPASTEVPQPSIQRTESQAESTVYAPISDTPDAEAASAKATPPAPTETPQPSIQRTAAQPEPIVDAPIGDSRNAEIASSEAPLPSAPTETPQPSIQRTAAQAKPYYVPVGDDGDTELVWPEGTQPPAPAPESSSIQRKQQIHIPGASTPDRPKKQKPSPKENYPTTVTGRVVKPDKPQENPAPPQSAASDSAPVQPTDSQSAPMVQRTEQPPTTNTPPVLDITPDAPPVTSQPMPTVQRAAQPPTPTPTTRIPVAPDTTPDAPLTSTPVSSPPAPTVQRAAQPPTPTPTTSIPVAPDTTPDAPLTSTSVSSSPTPTVQRTAQPPAASSQAAASIPPAASPPMKTISADIPSENTPAPIIQRAVSPSGTPDTSATEVSEPETYFEQAPEQNAPAFATSPEARPQPTPVTISPTPTVQRAASTPPQTPAETDDLPDIISAEAAEAVSQPPTIQRAPQTTAKPTASPRTVPTETQQPTISAPTESSAEPTQQPITSTAAVPAPIQRAVETPVDQAIAPEPEADAFEADTAPDAPIIQRATQSPTVSPSPSAQSPETVSASAPTQPTTPAAPQRPTETQSTRRSPVQDFPVAADASPRPIAPAQPAIQRKAEAPGAPVTPQTPTNQPAAANFEQAVELPGEEFDQGENESPAAAPIIQRAPQPVESARASESLLAENETADYSEPPASSPVGATYTSPPTAPTVQPSSQRTAQLTPSKTSEQTAAAPQKAVPPAVPVQRAPQQAMPPAPIQRAADSPQPAAAANESAETDYEASANQPDLYQALMAAGWDVSRTETVSDTTSDTPRVQRAVQPTAPSGAEQSSEPAGGNQVNFYEAMLAAGMISAPTGSQTTTAHQANDQSSYSQPISTQHSEPIVQREQITQNQPTDSTNTSSGGNNVDVNRLAQDVFARLRERLRIESERNPR